jgi:hypothetical protein
LIDARLPVFFEGNKAHSAAKRPGTLPGAINQSYAVFFEDDAASITTPADTAVLKASLGIKGDEEVISFCNTGHWAATHWFALSELADVENAKLYAGSIVEYSNADLPMENTPGMFEKLLTPNWLMILENPLSVNAGLKPRLFFRWAALFTVVVVIFLSVGTFAGLRFGLMILIGLGFGATLEGFRFGFAGPWRAMITKSDPAGIWAQLLAIGIVALFAMPLIGNHSTEITWSSCADRLCHGPRSVCFWCCDASCSRMRIGHFGECWIR